MKKITIEIKWAILFSSMMLIWMALERLVGLHDKHIDTQAIYTNFVAVPAIVLYVFALLDKRKNYYGGTMTYKQAFISGLTISFFVSALSPLTQFIISTIITPDYFSNAIRYTVRNGLMNQVGAENYFNLKNYIVQVLIYTPTMGVITTAGVAFFIQKKSKN